MQTTMTGWGGKLRTLLEMIKFSHTIFAFPFALMGVVLAARANGSLPTWGQLGWIVVAMVAARSAAMAINRVLDAEIDARNPRTAGRHIPAGAVSRREAWLFIAVTAAAFLLASAMLNRLCLLLAPFILALFVLYALAKRFTALAHIILGLCLGVAPIAAWIALRGDLQWPVTALGLAVLFWVAGFDIFYALQDREFDARAGLHSIPVALGPQRSIALVRLFHVLMVALLLAVGWGSGLGAFYYAGVAAVVGLLVYEHRLVKPDDLSRLDAAFFTMNGVISVVLFAFTLADALV